MNEVPGPRAFGRLRRTGAVFVLAALATAAAAAPLEQKLYPAHGQILLGGTVQSTTTTRRIVMTVTDGIQFDGETFKLTPPRSKQVILPEGTTIEVRGQPGTAVPIRDLRALDHVMVIGPDTGVGRDIPAQKVVVWTGWGNGKYQFDPNGVGAG